MSDDKTCEDRQSIGPDGQRYWLGLVQHLLDFTSLSPRKCGLLCCGKQAWHLIEVELNTEPDITRSFDG